MTPIKIFNPVYSGQQGHASTEAEDQIKNTFLVNPGHEGYDVTGLELQNSVSGSGARNPDQVYSQKLVQGAGYLLPGRMMHYGGSQQTGQDRPMGSVPSQFPSWGQIPPGIRLGGGHQVGQPEQWYRNSTSDLPNPAKIKKEIEAMMASFGLKAFDDSPSIRVPPTPSISATQVCNQQASSFYQEYSGPPQPKRARPNVKMEASPSPKEQNDPSQLSYNSSVPHLVVSPPPQRGVGNILLRQISSSYDHTSPNPPHQYDATSHNLQEQILPSQQVYINPPSHEYERRSPQEYANPLSHEYVGQSPQEYENPPSQEYIGHSPEKYVSHSPQDPSKEYIGHSPQDPSKEYIEHSPQDPSEEYVGQSLQDPSQEYARQSPQEYVNPLSEEYQVPSPNVGYCEESSLNILSTVCSSKSPIDPSITLTTIDPSMTPTTIEPSTIDPSLSKLDNIIKT